MGYTQEIEDMALDLDCFAGKRELTPVSSGSLMDFRNVMAPFEEDQETVRRSLDHVLENLIGTGSAPAPTTLEIKRLMGVCFRLGRRYEQLRGSDAHYFLGGRP